MAEHPTPEQEQALVRDFFGSETGYFVEIGVRHPSAGSQSFALERAGWSGVLFEPQPDLAAFLVTERAAKVFAVACVAPGRAGQPEALHVAAAGASAAVVAPTRTLDSVLDEAEAPAPIDLLAVHAAGRESDALGGFSFERWQPLLILVDDPVGSLRTHGLLKRNGYRLIRRVGTSGWYVPRDTSMRPSRQEKREIRRHYLGLPFRKFRNSWRDSWRNSWRRMRRKRA
jgi:hypothetical protein